MNGKNNNVFALTIVIIAIATTTGIIGWMFGQKKSPPEKEMATQKYSSKNPSESDLSVGIENWKKFDSKMINISFSHPIESNFQEENPLAERQIGYSGKKIIFKDNNNHAPFFEVITKDFSIDDSIIHDTIEGSLESEKSFRLKIYPDVKYSKIISKGPGIYQAIGVGGLEGMPPIIDSRLIVVPPKNSPIKYVSFYLGDAGEFIASDFANQDFQNRSIPKESSIQKKFNSVLEGKSEEIRKNLDLALKITSTIDWK